MKAALKYVEWALCLLFIIVMIMGAAGYLSIQRANEKSTAESNEIYIHVIEAVNNMAEIAKKHGLQVSDEQISKLIKKWIIIEQVEKIAESTERNLGRRLTDKEKQKMAEDILKDTEKRMKQY